MTWDLDCTELLNAAPKFQTTTGSGGGSPGVFL
eukprot:CAMPEP_0184312946 /NCGR_PEP_ID=MMETSP1049-20130417/57106_1 /TAXON_ID=77928 /ORGANISM="Proteomonas sulcata, Strain CCMP704" /LENGTH=32 /DNA_ID= /DNA_START= /DNA_END= /DNA_ORIENTATION=